MNKYVRNLERIEFVITMMCTGRCIHCSEGDHADYSGHIDEEIAVKAVRAVCSRYQIKSLMTFGGEPLLFPEVVYAIHRTAMELGIAGRQLITNGFFFWVPGRVKEVVHHLKESGVNDLLLSVDAFHQETIPLEPVKRFAEAVLNAGIPIRLSPAWLESREDENPYNIKTKEVLAEFLRMGIPEGSGNVIFPSGNALKYLGDYFDESTEYINPYEDDPRDIRAISFSPEGEVLNGNVYRKDILEILDEYTP